MLNNWNSEDIGADTEGSKKIQLWVQYSHI